MLRTESSVEPAARGRDTGTNISQREMANAVRVLAMDAVQRANSGHPGMPMGMADVATVLFSRFLKFDPSRPDWPDRDRFILSAGHGSMLQYALLYLSGYDEITLEELKNFRQLGSRTAGHPEYSLESGIETTTGPLGQGLANAVGIALAERLLNERFGDDLVDHHTYVIAGDGCLMEGISHEAASLAGHLGLGNLIVFFDDNAISIDGPTSLSVSDDQGTRFKANGWHVQSVDGHDGDAVTGAIEKARADDRPSLICCRTVIGYGAPNKAGTASTHGAPLGADEVDGTRGMLGWPHPPFEIPEAILKAWRATANRGSAASAAWERRVEALEPARRDAFRARMAGRLPPNWRAPLAQFKRTVVDEKPTLATRVSSQQVIEVLVPELPELIGGSADLTGSNGTMVAAHRDVARGDFSGGYVRYGVREHGMAAAMNGMALHGGIIPYGGTFLVFTDYCRPSIRLSALMGQRVIYVMTHDSIGLGEDGPTHQPVEHLASLRAVPNLNVFRPADTVETVECWELAVESNATPSVLALTRQGVPTVRTEVNGENLCALGAYVLSPAKSGRDVTLIATGSEVSLALEAQRLLQDKGVGAAVVSMPCWELFEKQTPEYRDEILGTGIPRVAVEAAASFGWERWIGRDGAFVGMRSFGASAPGKDLYAHFNITPSAVVEAVRGRL